MKKKLMALVIIFIALSCSAVSAAPFYDYSYDSTGKTVPAPRACELYTIIDSSTINTTLKGPSDLSVGIDNMIYIADTGNNRIVVLDKYFKFYKTIDSFYIDDIKNTFGKPEGVFAAQDGRLFIADTNNARLIILSQSGEFIAALSAPESDILPAGFDYKPTKVAVDKAGRIFVISRNFNMGLLEFDRNANFVQTLGAAKVVVNPVELFWRTISTREQINRTGLFVPTEYNNLSVDENGFIYVSSAAYDNDALMQQGFVPVRKLNASGDDILKRDLILKSKGDINISLSGSLAGPSKIVDVYSEDYGIYSILDARRGRIFTYDSNGKLLYIFGGSGDMKGTTKNPNALAKVDDMYLVLDGTKNNITVYNMKYYANLIIDAVKLHDKDDYENEAKKWQEIIKINANCEMAYIGMGKAYFRNAQFKKAMDYFKIANDKEDYSKAFQYYRRIVIEKYFPFIIPIFILLIILFRMLYVYLNKIENKTKSRQSFFSTLKYSFYVIFHPLDGFWDLKNEKRGSIKTALVLLITLIITSIASRQLTGFIFNGADPATLNIFVEILKIALPFFLWCISNWCVSSLMQGEGKFSEIFMATGYALTPMIILNIAGILFSNIFISPEADFYGFVITLGYFWSLALILLGNKQIHDYTMTKSLGVSFISAIVICIIIFTGVLVIVFGQQMTGFVMDIYNELVLRV